MTKNIADLVPPKAKKIPNKTGACNRSELSENLIKKNLRIPTSTNKDKIPIIM